MDRLDLNYWCMFYCMNVMIWVWLMSGIAAKLWVNIYSSVRGLALVKVRMYTSLVLHSSVYIMRYDIWSCSWIWLLLQSSIVCSVFWWLCYGQGFNVSVLGDLEIDNVGVVDGCISMMINFVLQCCWWVQYENWMKRGLQIMVLCFKSIQYENLWNTVHGGRKKIIEFSRLVPTYW